jgi:hypothetical protein
MRFGVLLSIALTSLSSTRAASSAACYALRPTSPDAAWSYAGAPVMAFDTPEGRVRVWFALEGQHAPLGAQGEQTPFAALAAGSAAEEALGRFETLGFRLPLADSPDTPCQDAGGDARLDIYLYDFGAADGTIGIEQCSEGGVARCAGFAIVENDFLHSGYANALEGYRTVVPHELFHLVQYAYSDNGEAWWAEGSAQWAAQQVFPELRDLEAFLPAFFTRTDRPLDFPAVGAAASFSYGAAIWPVFLSERHPGSMVRSVFEGLGEGAATVLVATDSALSDRGDSLDQAFTEFARWNAATGARAASSGYARAADYPEVALEPLPDELPNSTTSALAGLSARYFRLAAGERRRLRLDGNSEQLSAVFVPFAGKEARLANARSVPFRTSGAGVVVVSGRAHDHRDVPFTIHVEPAPATEPSGDAAAGAGGAAPSSGAGGDRSDQLGGMPNEPEPQDLPPDSDSGDAAEAPPRTPGGCSIATAERSGHWSWHLAAALAVAAGRRRRLERGCWGATAWTSASARHRCGASSTPYVPVPSRGRAREAP